LPLEQNVRESESAVRPVVAKWARCLERRDGWCIGPPS
jgi:hypothetical protein